MSPIIEVEKARKVYGDLVALDDVSLEIEEGTFFGLLGPNGAGKTTLIKILTTLLRPSRGTVRIAGYDALTDGKKIRKRIGVVFQENNLDRYLTARENLALHAKMHGMSRAEYLPKLQEFLEIMGLAGRQDEFPHRFSGGMLRRLAVARALIHSPQVLFLDEPTTGLDPQSRRVLWDYLLSLQGKTTLFLTTHNMEEVEELCHRIVIMDRGKVLADGTPSQLKALIEDRRVYEIDLRGSGERYQTLVAELPFVESCNSRNGLLEISLTQVDALKSLVALFDARDIRRIGVKESSLEEVYLHLTGRTIREC